MNKLFTINQIKSIKLGQNITILENGVKIHGKVTSYTLDSKTYGSTIVEKKYFVHWCDSRITKESTGLIYDTKTTTLKEIFV